MAQKKLTQGIKDLGQWLDVRLGWSVTVKPAMDHAIPKDTASWFYVFGSATMVAFGIQLVTGVCLTMVYTPTPDGAYTSLEYLNYQQPMGWYLRAVHYWGSNLMVALMTIHAIQVFLFGAFKYPRELTWVVGCVLFLATLGLAFTGQIMRFDQDAYWGLGIGASIMGRTPLIGPELVNAVLGGQTIGAETLSRFFALHVFIIPGALIGMLVLHLVMVFRLGVNEWPMPGRLLDKRTYEKWYHDLLEKKGVKFFPAAVGKDAVFGAIVTFGVLGCAAVFGPKGPHGWPDPTLIETMPAPDFYFMPLFSAFALFPPAWEEVLLMAGPAIGIAIFFAVPWLLPGPEKSFRRRPFSIFAVVLIMLSLIVLGAKGLVSPWSPRMNAWSGAAVPVEFLENRTPLELRGALVFQQKQCRNCHELGDEGGLRGPRLDDIATRMTTDQMIQQVIQGGGNMPAYGKQLSPAEVTALVAFMRTLHADHVPAAQPSDDLIIGESEKKPAPAPSGEGAPEK
jgi:ubiquinol-cytochrome c reductase cytochrome b subunit